jgi:aminoglycoside 6'-N-acetyltransferase
VIRFRPMAEDDLPAIAAWLELPHVARWWTADTTAEAELAEYRQRVSAAGDEADRATIMLMVLLDDVPVGWCQWYRWADYPADAAAMGARAGEIGIDYAIGDPDRIGRGVGTELIAGLVAEVRREHPGAGFLTDPDAANAASRRVLEKNGFGLVAVRPVATEPSDAPMAIYRLPGDAAETRIVLRADEPREDEPREMDDPIVDHPGQPADYVDADGMVWTWEERWRIVDGVHLRSYDRASEITT